MTVEKSVNNQSSAIRLEGSYLDDYRSSTRSKTIPWDGFARSELLSTQDAKRLNELEGATVKKRIDKIVSDEHLDDYVATLLQLLSKDLPAERSDIKKYVLVLISDLIQNPKFIDKLTALNKANPDVVLLPLIKHISDKDEVVKVLSLYNAASLLIQPSIRPTDTTILTKTFSVLNSLAESTSDALKYYAMELTTELLFIKEYRPYYWSLHTTVLPLLLQNLKSRSGSNSTEAVQVQYKILLIIWLCSFNAESLKDISKFYLPDLLILLDLVKGSIKEKIVRLAVAIIINLTSIPKNPSLSNENLKFFILSGDILPILNNLKERKWSDDELIEDLDILFANVQDIYSKLTSFDEYLQELNAKNFKNSPVHNNDEFFLDNLSKFQDNNYKIFKQLIGLLDARMEAKSYVNLLSDIGKILKLDSKAIEVLNKEDKKTKIMDLLNHTNSEVRYEALKATQFIVSQTFK